MQLIKFTTDDNPVMINPVHVVSVRKGMKDTQIQTLTGAYTVKDAVTDYLAESRPRKSRSRCKAQNTCSTPGFLPRSRSRN